MNRKQITLDMRVNHKLKGIRPAVVELRNDGGEIYKKARRSFVVSIVKDESISFQALSTWLKKLLPEEDFSLRLSSINYFTYRMVGRLQKTITLYTKRKRYLTMSFFYNTKDSYETEINLSFLMDYLKKHNILERSLTYMEEDEDGKEDKTCGCEETD